MTIMPNRHEASIRIVSKYIDKPACNKDEICFVATWYHSVYAF